MQLAIGLREVFRELTSRSALQSIPTGLICGLIVTVFSLSYAAFVFSGPLLSHIGAGVGVILLASAIMAIVGALLTSYAPTIIMVRDIAIAYLALLAPVIAAQAGGTAALPTTIALLAASSIIVGVTLLVLGIAGLGRVVRFVPFPVVNAFLAGVAWLIIMGALTVLIGHAVTLSSVLDLFAAEQLPKLLTMLAVTAAIIIGRRWLAPGLLVPLIVLVATALFHVVVGIAGSGEDRLAELGWLASMPSAGSLWPPFPASALADIDWGLVLSAWPTIAVIVVVTMIAVLLNVTGLEVEARRDIDLDAELKVAGITNALGGLVGGAPGYPSLSMTVLARRLNGGSRGSTIIAGAFVLLVLFFGSSVIGLVPLPVLAAIVLTTGADLLYERLIVSYRRLPRSEYLVVVAIFAATVFLGFLTAVIFGLLAAMALFVFDYSRAGVVKLELTGRDYQSSFAASEQRRRLLQEHGGIILMMRLQGYLFFGTANGLRRAIERRIKVRDENAAHFVILDFRRISGLDSAAVQSFVRLADSARDYGAKITLANVSKPVLRTLIRGGLPVGPDAPVKIAESFDRALAASEDAVIAAVDPALSVRNARSIESQLEAFADDPAEITQMATFLERTLFETGDIMIEEGTPAEDMFFVEAGGASVRIASDGHEITLATLGPGSIAGEIAFYLGTARTASVVADSAVVAWRFTKESLHHMEKDRPAVAARFHRGMAEVLADRLAATNRLVRFLAS